MDETHARGTFFFKLLQVQSLTCVYEKR